jgi:hypothetical protein
MQIMSINEEIIKLTTLKSFLYRCGKYHFDIAQLNKPVDDNGFIVTLDPKHGFHYLSTAGKRKDIEHSDGKLSKNPKTEVSTGVPCDVCGRSTVVKINGESYPHTEKNCFCDNYVDKNTSHLPWSKSPNGISFKSLGLSNLPHNKKLSSDSRSMIDYTMPQKEHAGSH